ncbi:MAG: hypothetical protein LBI71_10915 [Enterobacteriaceae bacterium]|nr:hypothetical protein [Enterobacteriaceae bacterium]
MANNTQKVIIEPLEIIFPSYYPHGVPPREAQDAEGTFFRIAKSSPPTIYCFKSMYESNPKRLKKFNGLNLKCCYGISVFTDEISLVNAFEKFPQGTEDSYIAKGVVDRTDGKMLKTGNPDSTHYTLWLGEDTKIHKKFSCIRGLVK